MRLTLGLFGAAVFLCGCVPTAAPAALDPVISRSPVAMRPQDVTPAGVRVLADPPPPYLYWAPVGSTVINHRNPGMWLAQIDGGGSVFYYGDGCGAADLQRWVGQPTATVERLVEGRPVRVHSRYDVVTSDLIWDRINIIDDRVTGLIERIECY